MQARQGTLDDPSRQLKLAGAPRDLVAWSNGRNIDELWDECDRGDWLIWLALLAKVPLVSVVESAEAAARMALSSLPKEGKRGPIKRALRAVRDLESSLVCAKRAEACEEIAGDPEATAYRDTPVSALTWTHAAAGCAARAAEALLAAEVRRAAERDTDGAERAATLGLAMTTMVMSRKPGPLVYQLDDELSDMCVHAAEMAVAHATRALLPPNASSDVAEQIEGALSEAVFDVLDPVRAALKQGTPVESVVRILDVHAYGDTEATRARHGELAIHEAPQKKAINARGAGLLVPLGGCAHLFADHRLAGGMLSASGVVFLMGAVFAGTSYLPWLTVIAADVFFAKAAIERFNKGEIPKAPAQVRFAVAVIALAVLLGAVAP